VAGRRLEQVTTEPLAERYRAERETDPDRAEITKTPMASISCSAQGRQRADHAKQVREAVCGITKPSDACREWYCCQGC
jgi:hypothetical protein